MTSQSPSRTPCGFESRCLQDSQHPQTRLAVLVNASCASCLRLSFLDLPRPGRCCDPIMVALGRSQISLTEVNMFTTSTEPNSPHCVDAPFFCDLKDFLQRIMTPCTRPPAVPLLFAGKSTSMSTAAFTLCVLPNFAPSSAPLLITCAPFVRLLPARTSTS